MGALALGTALHWVVMSVTAPIAWRVYLRIGPRAMMLLAGVLCAAAFAVLPATTSGATAVLGYGVLSGAGSHGIGQLVANRPLVGALPNGARRDRLFGLIAAGAPIGTAVFPAVGAVAVSAVGWAFGCAVLACLILAACLIGAGLTTSARVDAAAALPVAANAADARLWRTASFPLLAAGFALALFVQASVPYVIPLWGITGGYSATDVAIAFLVLGCSGLVGRLVMTRRIKLWGLRLWIVLPTTSIAVAGFLIAAAAPPGSAWFLPGIALMGFATPVIGALFAIASLACFPEDMFARVAGTLLVPIGLASAGSAALPGAVVDAGLPLSTAWLGLAALTVIGAISILAAELVSPLHRGRLASGAGQPHST